MAPSSPKNNSNGRNDLESQDYRNASPKDSETYQSTVLPASGMDFDQEQRKQFRTIANPGPLGLCGFALTTFVLSLVNVHARSVTTPNIVIGLGIFVCRNFVNIYSSCVWWSRAIYRRNVGVCVW